ncbi:hypothetical protein ACFFGG_12060 [Ottowia pentelensis]|uniref:Uncharacterized protein n=1 Tax=Ottowia pentelensis TaxID=511108 RepID=A0ABV6PTW6_9BURK|nr:hypothetical protein [Ottowia sp.]
MAELQDCVNDEVEASGDTVWAASGPHANSRAPIHDMRRKMPEG